jgi:hypothetical protein
VSAKVVDLLRRRPDAVRLETRRVRFGSPDRAPLRRGWLGNEWNPALGVHFVWATGPEATLVLDILDPRELQFLVRLAPFPSERPQRIEVRLNGVRVGEIEPLPGFFEYRFVAPAASVRRGRNRLSFHHSEFGPPPRRLAAAYTELLLGPNCRPLRPSGRPPTPTEVRREKGALVVRGPAELGWALRIPAAGRLRMRLRAVEGPARFRVEIGDDSSTSVLQEGSLRRGWLFSRGVRELDSDLSRWAGQRVWLRLRVVPEPCAAAFATVRIDHAGLLEASSPSPGETRGD